VKLVSRNLTLTWPQDVPARDLRAWLLDRLLEDGEPLRWAITAVHRPEASVEAEVRVEAVLIA